MPYRIQVKGNSGKWLTVAMAQWQNDARGIAEMFAIRAGPFVTVRVQFHDPRGVWLACDEIPYMAGKNH